MECLDQLKRDQVFCDLFFTLGVPFEKEKDLCETIQLQREIRDRYPHVRAIRTFTIEMEPGSPWHLDPEEFGVKTSLRDFMDCYHNHSRGECGFSSSGYWVPVYFGWVQDQTGFEEALQGIKCRYFCFLHPDARKSSSPFWGRRLCGVSNLYWKMKNWHFRNDKTGFE